MKFIISAASSTASTFVPSILLWIQRWRYSIRIFNDFHGHQHHELILGALAASSSLESVVLRNTPAAAVCALPMFKSLRRCDFDRHAHVNLTDLSAMPSLEELHLSAGDYHNVPSAGRLTTLFVQDGDVTFSKASTEDISFSCLRLFDCDLHGLHDDGLTACTALAHLEFEDAEFGAAHGYDALAVGTHRVASTPAQMSELTCLTHLDMVLACGAANHFELEWVYSIVSLKHLELKIRRPFEVSEQLSQLVELTSLTLKSYADTCQASYSVDWEKMQALKHLELAGQISFDSRVLQLTCINSLVCVNLTSLRACATDGTTSVLACLMYELAAHCPQVQVGSQSAPSAV